MEDEESSVTSPVSDAVVSDDEEDLTPQGQMRKGLFAVSRQPAKLSDIKSFQNLHSPRLHGMAEWVLQYESVCRRQEQYLQQIKDLRQRFRTKTDGTPLKPLVGAKQRQRRGYFWSQTHAPLTKPDDRFANKACVLHPTPKKHKINNSYSDFWQTPQRPKNSPVNFCMAPSSLSFNNPGFCKSYAVQHAKLPPIEDFKRNATDYEPIEHIAKRNKLNLNKYLNEGGKSWSKMSPRATVDHSDVYVQSTKIA